MTTPKKLEILRKAKSIAVEQQIRAGLPSITPTERELKETGVFQEAQIDLMRVDQEALSEQRRYLEEMADEMRLKIIPVKGLAALKRETGFEWTNGWTKHERKPKPTKRVPSPSILKEIESLIHLEKLTDKQLARRYKQLTATKKAWISGQLSNKYYRQVIDPGGVTGKVPKDVFLFTNLDPAISDFEKEMLKRQKRKPKAKPRRKIDRTTTKGLEKLPLIANVKLPPTIIAGRKKPVDRSIAKGLLKIVLKPKPKKRTSSVPEKVKKRKKSHIERSGKTMRALRKVNGVKVFAFPDDVWKVRKPRKKGKSRKRRQR